MKAILMEKINYKEIFKFNFKSEKEVEYLIKNCYYAITKDVKYQDTVLFYVDEVRRVYNNVLDERNYINYICNEIRNKGIRINEDDYNVSTNELTEIADVFSKHLDLISKYVTEKQKKCSHKWIEVGHDSHHTYYECPICGKEERD